MKFTGKVASKGDETSWIEVEAGKIWRTVGEKSEKRSKI